MQVITLNIPESAQVDDEKATMAMAAGLYGNGALSLGQAAEIVGLTKRAFAEILGNYGVSIFNYPAEDIANDVKNA